jgi:hypothetical protein
MHSRQRCQSFHKRASLANGLFSLPWCTSCTFDHNCPHHLFLVVKHSYFFFSIILVCLFFGNA